RCGSGVRGLRTWFGNLSSRKPVGSIHRLGGGRRPQPTRKSRGRYRPSLEALEDRAVPAVLTVNSLLDGPVDRSDTVVTLRDAVYAAVHDVEVSPGGPAGSGTETGTIVFDPALVAGGGATIHLSFPGGAAPGDYGPSA